MTDSYKNSCIGYVHTHTPVINNEFGMMVVLETLACLQRKCMDEVLNKIRTRRKCGNMGK